MHRNKNMIISQEPCLVTKEEVYEGCCCDSGVVVCKFGLRKTGFVPGEPMMFEICVENKSTSALCGLIIQLAQVTQYKFISVMDVC